MTEPRDYLKTLVVDEKLEDYFRRMFILRQPLPNDFVFQVEKIRGKELDYYNWAVVAEAMDAIFPGSWDFYVKNITHIPLGKVPDNKTVDGWNQASITVTVSVEIDGTLWDMPKRTRENTASSLAIAKWGPNEIAIEDATHTAFKRACAMFGLGRHLYIRDIDYSVTDALAARSLLNSISWDLREKLVTNIDQLTEDQVLDILATLQLSFSAPRELSKDEDSYNSPKGVLAKIETILDGTDA